MPFAVMCRIWKTLLATNTPTTSGEWSDGMKLSWMGTHVGGNGVTSFCLRLASKSSSRYVGTLGVISAMGCNS